MSQPTSAADLSPAETQLGRALAFIHRALPRLDEPARAAEVQAALQSAIAALEAARNALTGGRAALPVGTQSVATGVAPEIAAIIAAAIAVVVERPHRLVAVQPVTLPVVPHLNIWAFEGRTQIFMSHKVR
jgi:hypothetical protein